MSIFAAATHVTLSIPHDPPHTVTIRRLTGREYQAAQDADLAAMIGGRSARGWSKLFTSTLEGGQAAGDKVKAAELGDPLNGFDRFTIARAGVVAWTYPAVVESGKPVSIADLVDRVDDETVEWLAREILRVTKPALFHSEDEQEDASKNDSRPSTAA